MNGDVPYAAVGGLTSSSELFGFSGWTGNSLTALPASVCSASGLNPATDTCSGNLGFFDNIDQTAPLDVTLSQPQVATPEAPAAPLLLGLGLVAVLAGGYARSRRRRA